MHLRSWGPEPRSDEPRWLLLHGYQDTGDTFQFLVDAFERDWPLTALDWRGFGRSDWSQNGYWFHDYLADLDALLDLLSGAAPVRLIGHSMGGNIASLYAGVRPERVRSLVNLEGFGMPRTTPDRAPAQLAKWLDQVKSIPPLKDYESFEQLASIIRYRYPRFGEARAGFVAHAWGRLETDGRVHLLGDSRHRWVNPTFVPARRCRGLLAPHHRARAHDGRGAVGLSAAPGRRWRRGQDALDHPRASRSRTSPAPDICCTSSNPRRSLRSSSGSRAATEFEPARKEAHDHPANLPHTLRTAARAQPRG